MKIILFLITAVSCASLPAATFEEQVADRAAIERVYHSHRIGATEPFEQALPVDELRRLVSRDHARELALFSRYGVIISSNQVAAEVERINRTTRAPEMLAEIKAALGDDPARFAEAFAKPAVVERELRARFQNDDALHSTLRRDCESLRTNLLADKAAGATPEILADLLARTHPGKLTKLTWSLRDHSQKQSEESAAGKNPNFESLPPQLRTVLSAQLRTAGDISAVIETPETFLLYVAIRKNADELSAACLTLPKPDCDIWLAAQTSAAGRSSKSSTP